VKKSGFQVEKSSKAFHRSHFLNSLSFFSSLSSVFVGFGEKFKKTEKADKRTLIKTQISLCFISSTTSKHHHHNRRTLL